MKAAICRNSEIVIDELVEPTPGPGQVLVKSLACGICGSDLHCLHDLKSFSESAKRAGAGDWIDPDRDMVFGHEFCGEILDHAPGNDKVLKPGVRVVSMPFVVSQGKMEWVGISNHVPGAFAERFLLTESLLLPVPNGLSSEQAAMVEPMAVGAHAVAQAQLVPGTPAVVIGCGPVGLAVIASLKLAQHGPIVAADFSPERRRMAEVMGADIVIDPAKESPHTHWESFGVAPTISHEMSWAVSGRSSRPAVAFECVGAPGLIQSLIFEAPPGTQIVVVGACLRSDAIEPGLALNKQMMLRFVRAYTGEEFAATLHDIAEGRLDVSPMISGTVGLDGVAAAFDRLGSPGSDVKIIVKPN